MKKLLLLIVIFFSFRIRSNHPQCVGYGEYSYGQPNIKYWGDGTTYSIGKFCSIADEVWIFLGGNHRLDWISAYPLPTDPQGVRQALKDYYGLTFDIDAYAAQIIQKNNAIWQIVHYPYCNSVTVTQAC